MKAFRFALERVLHWRRLHSQIEQEAARQMRRAIAGCEAEARALETERQENELAVRRGAPALTLREWRQRLRRREVALQEKQRRLEGDLALQQDRVLEAERAVRLLEKLREGRRLAWSAAVAKEQEEFAAEAFLHRWNSGQGAR